MRVEAVSQAPNGGPRVALSLAVPCRGGVRLPVPSQGFGELTPAGLGGADRNTLGSAARGLSTPCVGAPISPWGFQ